MKFELVRFYYSSTDEPAQRYHTDNERALQQLEKLEEKDVEVEIFDVNEIEDLFPHYHRATVGPKVAMRPVFGAKGALEEDFGRGVPALVCYQAKDDLYPSEVFPRMDKTVDRMLGVNEALDNLLTYDDTVAPAVEAPIPDEEELEPSVEPEEPVEVDLLEEIDATVAAAPRETEPAPARESEIVEVEEAVAEVSEEAAEPSPEPAARVVAAVSPDVIAEEETVAVEPHEPEKTVEEAPAREEKVVTPAEPRFEQPPPAPPPRARAAEPQRDGCLATVLEWLVLLFLGTVLGTALALGILYALNGTLDFSQVRGVRRAQSAIAELQGQQSQLQADIGALEGEADRLSQSLANLEEKANTLEDYTGVMRNELENVKDDIETTSEEVNLLQLDVKAVATESAQFDSFLTRLRDVLIDIQGTPVPTDAPMPTATSSPTVTPTRTPTSSPTVTRTPTAAQTPTVAQTPTAAQTPTVQATSTAEETPATETPAEDATAEPTETSAAESTVMPRPTATGAPEASPTP